MRISLGGGEVIRRRGKPDASIVHQDVEAIEFLDRRDD
jgi:hypothetical protein